MGGLGPVGIGLGAIGAIGGLLGGNKGPVQNPYGTIIGDDLNESGSAGRDLTGTGASDLTQYAQFQPQANNATENELNYLNTSPYTDSYSQAKLSAGTGHAMAGFTQAKSALASDLGSRGLASSGGASSELAGGDAGIDASEAGTLASGQNSIAMDAIQQHASNLAQANQVAAAHAGSLFSQGSEASGQGAGILGSDAQAYDNLGQQQIADTTAADNAGASAWSGLAGLGGTLASGALSPLAKGNAVPAPPPYVAPSPSYTPTTYGNLNTYGGYKGY